MFRTKKSVRDRLFKDILSGVAAARIIRLNVGTTYYHAWLKSVFPLEGPKKIESDADVLLCNRNAHDLADDDKSMIAAMFLGCVNLGLIHELDDPRTADFILKAVFPDVYGLHAYLSRDCEPPAYIEERTKKTFEIYRNVSTWQFAKDVEWHCDPIEKLIARIDDLSTGKERRLAELFDYCAFKPSVVAEFYGYVRGLARGYKVAVTGS